MYLTSYMFSFSSFHPGSPGPGCPIPQMISVSFSRLSAARVVPSSPFPCSANIFRKIEFSLSFLYILYFTKALRAWDCLFSTMFQYFSVGFKLQGWFRAESMANLGILEELDILLVYCSPFHGGSPGLGWGDSDFLPPYFHVLCIGACSATATTPFASTATSANISGFSFSFSSRAVAHRRHCALVESSSPCIRCHRPPPNIPLRLEQAQARRQHFLLQLALNESWLPRYLQHQQQLQQQLLVGAVIVVVVTIPINAVLSAGAVAGASATDSQAAARARAALSVYLLMSMLGFPTVPSLPFAHSSPTSLVRQKSATPQVAWECSCCPCRRCCCRHCRCHHPTTFQPPLLLSPVPPLTATRQSEQY